MKKHLSSAFLTCALLASSSAQALSNGCSDLPSQADLKSALTVARKQDNGGLNLDMWATVVDRSGTVCAVAFSGDKEDAQWPLSRVISAQKANTANGLSLKGSALSTANLYSGTQPGGFLFGLQESNPVNTVAAYKGDSKLFGSAKDPLVGERIGGVNVFGGGLPLYNSKGNIVGGLGVSGDTSCADHNIAWRTRNTLSMDFVPSGVAPDKTDQVIYDISSGKSSSGFGHPSCIGTEDKISETLPKVRRVATPE